MPECPLCSVVVCGDIRKPEKYKKLLEKRNGTGSKRTHRCFCLDPWSAECTKFVFIALLLSSSYRFLEACGKRLIGTTPCCCFLVERIYLLCPSEELAVLRICFHKGAHVPEVMHPAALMKSGIDIVCGIEIRREYAGEVIAQYLFNDLFSPALSVTEIVGGFSIEAPPVPIPPVFPPAGFIRMDMRATPNDVVLLFIEWFPDTGSLMEQPNDCSIGEMEIVDHKEILTDRSNRLTADFFQDIDHTGESNTNPLFAYGNGREVWFRTHLFSASETPAFHDDVLSNGNRSSRNINHLTGIGNDGFSKLLPPAIRTGVECVDDLIRWYIKFSGVPLVSYFAVCLLFRLGVWFHERRWGLVCWSLISDS